MGRKCDSDDGGGGGGGGSSSIIAVVVVVAAAAAKKAKAVPLHAMKALGGRGYIAPTHSRPRH
jgi:hypothetical protein